MTSVPIGGMDWCQRHMFTATLRCQPCAIRTLFMGIGNWVFHLIPSTRTDAFPGNWNSKIPNFHFWLILAEVNVKKKWIINWMTDRHLLFRNWCALWMPLRLCEFLLRAHFLHPRALHDMNAKNMLVYYSHHHHQYTDSERSITLCARRQPLLATWMRANTHIHATCTHTMPFAVCGFCLVVWSRKRSRSEHTSRASHRPQHLFRIQSEIALQWNQIAGEFSPRVFSFFFVDFHPPLAVWCVFECNFYISNLGTDRDSFVVRSRHGYPFSNKTKISIRNYLVGKSRVFRWKRI